ncbi:MAG: hypothetical protein K2X81_12710 [Candidatus Obscuribacterales bacterium]|nr:hypothetical protein [Candidatus Obscuribacterales bacterium]
MVQIVETSGLKIASGPYKARQGLYPMIVALFIGFCFSALWLTVSVMLILDGKTANVVWGIITGLSTLLYCFYMGFIAYKLTRDSQRHYLLEITYSEAVLTVRDKLHGKKSTQMVLLDDIKYAEYYPYPDSSSVILHAPYTVMEIPLWPLGTQAHDVMDFLSGRGIPIVNAQFDDRIPEK